MKLSKPLIALLGLLSLSFIGCSKNFGSDETKKDEQVTVVDDQIFANLNMKQTSGFRTQSAENFGFFSKPWKNGLVAIKFEFDATQDEKDLFFEACREWEIVANVKCVERDGQGDYVHVYKKKDEGCKATVGLQRMFFVKDRMNLEDPGCWHKGIIIHELGHILGLIHEHQRVDRDQYITINQENIEPDYKDQLMKIRGKRTLSTYDFESIMHYRKTAFSKNGLDTITPKPGYEEYLDGMGQRMGVSELDALGMAAIYGPPSGVGLSGDSGLAAEPPIQDEEPEPAPTPQPGLPSVKEKASGLVYVLYTALLGRSPDFPGSDGYVTNIQRNDLAGFYDNLRFISASYEFNLRTSRLTAEEIVQAMYQGFLFRNKDAFADQVYVPLVRQGRAAFVAQEITRSQEFIDKAVIAPLPR